MINIIKYPDSSSYVKVEKFEKEFTFKINSYEDLWNLKQITDTYEHNSLRPIITIPNLIDAQADRRFNSNESNNLKLVCDFLNKMNADFKIFHPHNPEVVEALIDNVEIIDNSNFIIKVLKDLSNKPMNVDDELILMSSDAGGFKPLMKLCDKLNWQGQTISASKSRLWDGKESRLVQQIQCEDFEGKDILIIDDICVFGGTFKGLSKLLKEKNCGKLYLAVSHMTVQNLGEDPVTNYFHNVFTTNSKFNSYRAEDNGTFTPKNLEIIKLF